MRVLLVIGCNHFDHAKQLSGAEKDARRVFEALIRPEIGQYDPKLSRLLLSPTLEQVRDGLKSVLFNTSAIETFTFFFAGHGGVSSGSFYMWVRDSSPDAQSMTALSLADLFRSLNEAAPQQSNIIIDACESGGLIADLGVLLKPNLLGDAGTPALTLIATSSQDQSAAETHEGGLGTNAILDCIEGRDFVQDSASVLDLVEIGRHISTRLAESGQNPIVWGLNLYGPPSFCRNPRFTNDPTAPLRDVVLTWPAGSDNAIRRNYDALWSAYTSISGVWEADRFCEVIRTVLAPINGDARVLSNQAHRLAITFLLKASEHRDPFRAPQVAACLATCLLPHVEWTQVAAVVQNLMEQCCTDLIQANKYLIAELSVNKYALLSNEGGGLSDLYQLPIRIAKVLGWAATAMLLCPTVEQYDQAKDQFSELLKLILDNYRNSIVAISDAQAPFWAVALSSAAAIGLKEEAEQLAGHIFYSLLECSGKLAHWDISSERVLTYLIARASNDFSQCAELVERPVETLAVMLRTANVLGLEDVFDEGLWKLDGLPFAAYFPSSHLDFGDSMMKGGRNYFWSIGHDVFRTSDFVASWPSSTNAPKGRLIAAVAIGASLLLQDRVPWFVFEKDHLTDCGLSKFRQQCITTDKGASMGLVNDTESPTLLSTRK